MFTPRGRDAVLAAQIIEQDGNHALVCSNIDDLVAALENDLGALIATEEAFARGDIARVAEWIAQQEPWSDLPIVLLSNGGQSMRSPAAAARLEALGNVVLLERPLHRDALSGAIRSALKARTRQYEVYNFSRTLEDRIIERTRELETTRESLQLALDAADMGSWDLDLVTGVARRSLRHDQIFGYQELLSDWSRDIFLSHVVASDRARIARLFDVAGKSGQLDLECEIMTAVGDVRWIAAKGCVHYADDGTAIRMTGVVADIDDRKKSDAQAAQTIRLESIGQMTSGFAHDFNNLIQAVTSGFSMIDKWSDDPRVKEVAQMSTEAARRGSGLIKQMLAFARQQRLELQPINLIEFLTSVEPMLRIAAPDARIVISRLTELPKVWSDKVLLEAALVNFAVNARDSFPGGIGQITIAAETVSNNELPNELRGRSAVRLSFSDDGSGIPADLLERVIEPFFTTKDVGKGSGLGLASANGFAHQSGGTMRINSDVGVGTTISLYLPTADAIDSNATLGSFDAAIETNPRLLLVDDDPLVRSMTAFQLQDLGYAVTQAASAAEAMAHADELHLFLGVVSDVAMPECDGPTMIASMRQKQPDLPVLFITGNAKHGQLNGERVLHKPFDGESLASAVKQMAAS